MLWSLSCSCDKWQVNVCCSCRRQLFLCFLCCFFQTLHCHLISRKVNALCLLKFRNHVVTYFIIKVVTTKFVITGSRKYFDDTITNLNDGNIKCTTTKVIYHNLLLAFIIQTISKRCCCWLVDNTFYIQTCNFTCIFGCLTLCVVKVSRNCNYSLCYLLTTKVILCIAFQFLKNHSGNFLWCVFLVINCCTVIRTHMSLNRRNGLFCICYCLTLCRLTNQTLTSLCKCYNRWGCSCALSVCYNNRFTTFHYCYTTVCCS